jgi:hypothetical protein
MTCKLAALAIVACLPLAALGAATNASASVKTVTSRLDALRLKVTSRSGTTVVLEKAALIEQNFDKAGSVHEQDASTAGTAVRLKLPDGGTVTIPWADIEKITVGERGPMEKIYPLEITVRGEIAVRAGSSYGYNNIVVGQSEAGAFTMPLEDVKEIIVLPPSA